MFAPVYFPRPVYLRAGFSYALSIVVDTGSLQFSLFACPRYSHFYFGDYYDQVYVSLGIFPRYECDQHHTWYDPIYEHDRWRHHRTEPDWGGYERREYDRRRADRDLRPPRTYREMEERAARMPESQRREVRIASPLSTVVAEERTPLKFKEIRTEARQRVSKEATSVYRFGEARSRWESPAAGPETVRSPTERERPMTPPTGRRESETPSREHRGPAVSSPGHGERAAPSAERGPTFVPPREVNLTRPERVTIPKPPIVNRQRGLGIFRKSPPSRPSDEQRTDLRRTSR